MRGRRKEHGLTQDDVESQARDIAVEKNNRGFRVSRSYLSDIECGKSMPGPQPMQSLAWVYHRTLKEVQGQYGMEPEKEEERTLYTSWPSWIGPTFAIDTKEERRCLMAIANRFRSKETVKLEDEEVAELIPSQLLGLLRQKRVCFALTGTEDDSMEKLLPPDSFVMVDTGQKTLDEGPWETQVDRPIFLVWLPHGYVCRWAYQVGNNLTLLPYEASPHHQVESWKTSKAIVVGRVIHAWHLPRHASQAAAAPDRKPKGRMGSDD